MLKTLYPIFQKWSEKGNVWLISDTHFNDSDCLLMDIEWPQPEEFASNIAKLVHKNDTLIHLGDVGDPAYLKQTWKKGKKPYLVLVAGNHDAISRMDIFDEIYTGPLVISKKIILSHEPIELNWGLNIHGHDHADIAYKDIYHLNLASNVIKYQPIRLKDIINSGRLNKIDSIHRLTINKQIARKYC